MGRRRSWAIGREAGQELEGEDLLPTGRCPPIAAPFRGHDTVTVVEGSRRENNQSMNKRRSAPYASRLGLTADRRQLVMKSDLHALVMIQHALCP